MEVSSTHIWLDDERHQYDPGDVLAGGYQIDIESAHDLRAIELSVMWYTDGKGDSDMSVHYFERRVAEDPAFVELIHPQAFATPLPDGPLSYNGVIVKVKWCVRLRIFPALGREVVVDYPFRLGDVPAPIVEPTS